LSIPSVSTRSAATAGPAAATCDDKAIT
jgi:hypothetical protein